ncbi:YrhB domain-containing protein [Micromonospora coxensis]|uniref:YrhB domain-containing protein n=1 Tax=Micromonospora coxensis TaxID=356852 RepID=UPI003430BA84
MINEREARDTAEEVLRAMSSEPDMPRLAITRADEHPNCWVFFYQSVRYLETGSFLESLVGNAPILVDRNTGQPHLTGTAQPIDYHLAEYADGRHTCHLCRPPGSLPRP